MIEALISSKTRIKILYKFFLNSSNTAYLRRLEEEFSESTNSIRIELNRFEKAGFLTSYYESNKRFYRVNTKHPLFNEIHKIVMKLVGLDKMVDDLLSQLGQLDKVFLVGDLSKGINTGVIEIILIGDIKEDFLKNLIYKTEKKINKKIKYSCISEEKFNMLDFSNEHNEPLVLWSK